MKKLCLGALLSLTFCAFAHAQNESARVAMEPRIDFAATSAAHISLLDAGSSRDRNSRAAQPLTATRAGSFSASSFRGSTASATLPGGALPPTPAPNPNSYDVTRWQLAVGFAWERFRSNIFNASAVGINSSVTYFFRDWFGMDGQVSAMFAPTILQNEHVKLANYGVGPRIAWRGRRYEPFAHVLVGGAHALPQTAGNSQNALMIQAGGGADYRLWPVLSLRGEADYLRTGFFGTSQNNLFLSAGFVFNF